jgi:hypothetical protein
VSSVEQVLTLLDGCGRQGNLSNGSLLGVAELDDTLHEFESLSVIVISKITQRHVREVIIDRERGMGIQKRTFLLYNTSHLTQCRQLIRTPQLYCIVQYLGNWDLPSGRVLSGFNCLPANEGVLELRQVRPLKVLGAKSLHKVFRCLAVTCTQPVVLHAV